MVTHSFIRKSGTFYYLSYRIDKITLLVLLVMATCHASFQNKKLSWCWQTRATRL